VKIGAGAGRGGPGLLPGCGWGLRCAAGVRVAGWVRGLPVRAAVFGMRTRQLAWRWGLDLRVAFCCLERAGQYSGPGARRPGLPGSPLLSRRSSMGGGGEQTAGDRRPGARAGPRAGGRGRRGQGLAMVGTRIPDPSRPGARRSTVWTVRARVGAVRITAIRHAAGHPPAHR
jgi:hypothetical protein